MLPCAQSFNVDRSGETKAIEASCDSPGSRLLGISGEKEGFRSFSGLSSGSLGEGQVHRAAKQRGPCRQSLHALHSRLAEKLAEFFEADGIWSPSIRPGSFILHDQTAICHRQKPSQQYLLLLNEVQRIAMRIPSTCWRRRLKLCRSPTILRISTPLCWSGIPSRVFRSKSTA